MLPPFLLMWIIDLVGYRLYRQNSSETVMEIEDAFMKKIYFWVMLVFFYSSSVCAESWMLRSMGPDGSLRETRWEIQESDGSIGYFLVGQNDPVYVLRATSEGSQITLANGMIRRFGPGFLLLTDLPQPVFLPSGDGLDEGEHCFQEYVGETVFQSCVQVKLADSLDQARSLPRPQPGEVILVKGKGRLEAIIGADFQAERVDQG